MAVSGILAGVLEESPGKIPGKLLENCSPESPNATNSRISGTGKGKPAGNLGSPHCRDLVPTFRAGCFLKKSTVPAFSSFSEHNLDITILLPALLQKLCSYTLLRSFLLVFEVSRGSRVQRFVFRGCFWSRSDFLSCDCSR